MGRGHHYRYFRTALGIALLVMSMLIYARASAQCVNEWLFGPDQGDPGIPGDVYATLEWTVNTPGGPRQVLVAAGSFRSAGQALANSIAYWDGEWHPFGAGVDQNQFPYNQSIRALCIYQGELIAAGSFTEIDTVPANSIARWNGSNWAPLALGISGTVNTLCVIGDTLYAGGLFAGAGGVAANNIAAWNGDAWSTLGDGLPQSSQGVKSLVEFQGQLRAGGQFAVAGVTNRSFASWNGSTWQGSATLSNIESMSVYGGALFATDGSTAVRKWNGTVWTNAGALGQTLGNATRLLVHNGLLIAAGSFTSVRGIPAHSVASFDGSKWSPVGSGIHNPRDGSDFVIRTLTTFGSNLIAAGTFVSEAPLSRSIAQWNGESWNALGHGICTPPAPHSSLAGQAPMVGAFNTWNGDLVMGGLLSGYGSTPSSTIALRRNGEWKALADGLTHSSDTAYVGSIIPFGNQLIAGGSFNRSGQTTLSNIAAWNGAQWSPLGLGLNKQAISLAVFNEELIAAGNFTSAGGVSAAYIARWDGTEWHALDAGANGPVYALEIYQGELIAAGRFTSIGGVEASRIARWNGARWASLDNGADVYNDGGIVALAVHEGALVVGGSFDFRSVSAKTVARWDGRSWSSFGDQLSHVSALGVHHGRLFAGAVIRPPNALEIRTVAEWDGSSWQTVGTGFDSSYFARALFSSGNELLVGGHFTRVNGQVSIAWARYGGCSSCPADLDGDSNVSDTDFALFAEAYDILNCTDVAMPTACASDFSRDGFVDDADFLAFIVAYDAMTCP